MSISNEGASEMSCQCDACMGTGKCSTCSGTGQVEGDGGGKARRARRDRIYSHGLEHSAVWRYQALSPATTQVASSMDCEQIPRRDANSTNPKCAEAKASSCSVKHWRPCNKCRKHVCEIHDFLVPVWSPETGTSEPFHMICKECIAALWSREEISNGTRLHHIN